MSHTFLREVETCCCRSHHNNSLLPYREKGSRSLADGSRVNASGRAWEFGMIVVCWVYAYMMYILPSLSEHFRAINISSIELSRFERREQMSRSFPTLQTFHQCLDIDSLWKDTVLPSSLLHIHT